MTTIREIIAQVDGDNPNAFSPKTKLKWIAQLDGKIALDVMLMDASETEQFRYQHPEGMDIAPLVKFPHDDIYELWLNMKIHAAQGETERYQNALLLYNAAYKNYVRWFAHTYSPAGNSTGAVTYYITAYGLAVQQGYSGSLDDWLASLKGEKGDPGDVAFETLTEEQIEMLRGPEGLSAYQVAVRRGFIGTADDWLESLVGAPGEKGEPGAKDALPYAGGTMKGDINMDGHRITNVPEPTDDTDAVSRGYMDGRIRYAEATLTAAGWSESAPYSQSVAVEGVLPEKPPHVSPVYSGDNIAEQMEAAGCVSYATPGTDLITFVCLTDRPETDIPIQVEVHR